MLYYGTDSVLNLLGVKAEFPRKKNERPNPGAWQYSSGTVGPPASGRAVPPRTRRRRAQCHVGLAGSWDPHGSGGGGGGGRGRFTRRTTRWAPPANLPPPRAARAAERWAPPAGDVHPLWVPDVSERADGFLDFHRERNAGPEYTPPRSLSGAPFSCMSPATSFPSSSAPSLCHVGPCLIWSHMSVLAGPSPAPTGPFFLY